MISDTSFALWPIAPFGAEGEAGASGSDTAGGDTGASGDADDAKPDDTKGKSDSDSDDDDDDDLDTDEFKGMTPAELRKVAAKNAAAAKEAEKQRQAAQAKIDAEDRKKNDKETNLQIDLDKEKKITATLRATVVKQAIEAAIRDDDRFVFHDVEMAANVAVQINPDITVSDEGKVEGLKATLAKVAKQHEFMVKEDKTIKKDDTKNGGVHGPSGLQPGQGGTSGGGGDDVDKAALAVHYPALATARV